jgi:hypothetical protein
MSFHVMSCHDGVALLESVRTVLAVLRPRLHVARLGGQWWWPIHRNGGEQENARAVRAPSHRP